MGATFSLDLGSWSRGLLSNGKCKQFTNYALHQPQCWTFLSGRALPASVLGFPLRPCLTSLSVGLSSSAAVPYQPQCWTFLSGRALPASVLDFPFRPPCFTSLSVGLSLPAAVPYQLQCWTFPSGRRALPASVSDFPLRPCLTSLGVSLLDCLTSFSYFLISSLTFELKRNVPPPSYQCVPGTDRRCVHRMIYVPLLALLANWNCSTSLLKAVSSLLYYDASTHLIVQGDSFNYDIDSLNVQLFN